MLLFPGNLVDTLIVNKESKESMIAKGVLNTCFHQNYEAGKASLVKNVDMEIYRYVTYPCFSLFLATWSAHQLLTNMSVV